MMSEKNVTNEENVKKEVAKHTDKNDKKEKGRSLKDWFLDIKGEYGKIIWPKRAELVKETFTVIFTSALVGIIILTMDGVFAQAYSLFVQYVKI